MSLVEKYRPKSFDSEYLIKTKPIRELEERVNIDRELPHLIFTGDAGVGKTTIAYILIRKIFNLTEEDRISDHCLDINASKESGIETIRGKIKDYAKSRPLIGDKRYIFLDECDTMSSKAQPALRRVMEDYSSSCTFILACNYPHQIIEPVKERCALFNFPLPDEESIFRVVDKITEEENINITNEAIYELIKQYNCHIRGIINFIDGHSANLLIEKSDISIETKSQELVDLVLTCKDVSAIRNYFKETKFDDRTTASTMLEPINEKLLDNPIHGSVVEKLAETVYRMYALSGTDGRMQLYNFCVWLYNTNRLMMYVNDINIVKSKEIPMDETIKPPIREEIVAKDANVICPEPSKSQGLTDVKGTIYKEKSAWDDLK